MADLRPAVQGDIGDTRLVRLDGITNLNAATTVVAHIYTGSRSVATHVATLTAEVDDPADCTITINLGAADGWLATAAPGRYLIEYQVTFASGDIITWPAAAGDRIQVRAQGDPPP